MGKQKRYSLEFRERAVRRMKLGDNVSRLARELGVDRTCLYIWKRKLEQDPTAKEPIRKNPTGAITGSRSWRPRLRAWRESLAGCGWIWIFSRVPCEGSRGEH